MRKNTHCKKCHIVGKPGVALKDWTMKTDGGSVHSPKNSTLIKVIKCPKCGASWTKK